MTSFTWTYYQETIHERENINMFNYNITFTHMLVPSIENAYRIAYTKGQVKPLTCYLTIKKEMQDYFWITS